MQTKLERLHAADRVTLVKQQLARLFQEEVNVLDTIGRSRVL